MFAFATNAAFQKAPPCAKSSCGAAKLPVIGKQTPEPRLQSDEVWGLDTAPSAWNIRILPEVVTIKTKLWAKFRHAAPQRKR